MSYIKKTNCDFCALNFADNPTVDRANHIRWCDLNPSRISAKKNKIITCKCGVDFTIDYKSRVKTCSPKCRHGVSDEKKQILSAARSRYLIDNPEKHPWKNNDKFKSAPCERFKEYLTLNDIEFVEEFRPLSDRAFSIDIAFPHIMIGIEINGNQHYESDGSLKEYYQIRHDLIEKAGWRLIEVHYSRCFDDANIASILNFNIPCDDKGLISSYKKKQQQNKIEKTQPRGKKIRDKYDAKWEDSKNDIFNHGVDFSKFGWVLRVSKITGILHGKVNKWMMRYHPEFYDDYCFKRKKNLL